MIEFFKQIISFIKENDKVVNFLFGLLSGIVIAILTILLTYRFNWRNRLVKEFFVNLKLDFKKRDAGKLSRIKMNYEINSTIGEEISINYIFFKIPKSIKGNNKTNDTIGEKFFQKGIFYIQRNDRVFKNYLSDSFEIADENLLMLIDQRRLRKIRIVVNTNKYGNVKSNRVKLT